MPCYIARVIRLSEFIYKELTMSKRLAKNRNLKLTPHPTYKGLEVITSYGPLIDNYLSKIYSVLMMALTDYARTFAIRVDLHYPRKPDCPDYPCKYLGNEVSRFIASLRAQIDYLRSKSIQAGKTVHPCKIRYIWVKERNEANQYHYHLVLFFNLDAYGYLGDLSKDFGNLSARIRKAWSVALGVSFDEAKPLVQFPDNRCYRINKNAPTYQEDLQSLFFRLSYFAKVNTKHYGDHHNSFGCSRN